MSELTYYKVLNTDGSCYHGGSGVWPENEWMPPLDSTRLEPCVYGYHILLPEDVIFWLGPAIAPVTINGPVMRHTNKTVVAQAKRGSFLPTWNARTQRLFAADCAEHVLHLFAAKYPDDDRPAKAIQIARGYADGLNAAAAAAAAYANAADAAYAAADAAAYANAAYAADAAAYAAYANAADAAARADAADAAARADAAYAAARTDIDLVALAHKALEY